MLKEGDEVTYAVTMPRETHGGGATGAAATARAAAARTPPRGASCARRRPRGRAPDVHQHAPGGGGGELGTPRRDELLLAREPIHRRQGAGRNEGVLHGARRGAGRGGERRRLEAEARGDAVQPPPPTPVVSGGAAGRTRPSGTRTSNSRRSRRRTRRRGRVMSYHTGGERRAGFFGGGSVLLFWGRGGFRRAVAIPSATSRVCYHIISSHHIYDRT